MERLSSRSSVTPSFHSVPGVVDDSPTTHPESFTAREGRVGGRSQITRLRTWCVTHDSEVATRPTPHLLTGRLSVGPPDGSSGSGRRGTLDFLRSVDYPVTPGPVGEGKGLQRTPAEVTRSLPPGGVPTPVSVVDVCLLPSLVRKGLGSPPARKWFTTTISFFLSFSLVLTWTPVRLSRVES